MTFGSNDSDNPNHVSIENVEAFVRDNSPEVVQGYFMALNDIYAEAIEITYKAVYENGAVPNPAGTVRQKMLNFSFDKYHLIQKFSELGITLPKP